MVPYFCIYRVIEVILTGNNDFSTVVDNLIIIVISIFIRYIAFALSVVLSHKGAYKTLFR